jgi:copper resistance protein B
LEIAPALYFRGGAVAGRFEGFYNLYITQRLILQPQIELNFYRTRDPGRGIGTGLSDLDGGVRLGYQISRKFAPYVGFAYTGLYGETATFARREGQFTRAARLAFGIWVWR